MKRIILSFQFLTIIPIRTESEVTGADLSGSMVYFPLVGLFQGALLFGLYRLLSMNGAMPDFLIAGVLLFALTLTNGGLHLDGFADTVDGLAGGRTPEDRLRIMKDSATGAVGMVFLILIILLKYLALLGALTAAGGVFVLLFPVAARWAMVPLASLAPYARREGGLGEAFAGFRPGVLAASSAIAFLSSFIAGGVYTIAPLLLLALLAYLSSAFFCRRLGGITGDVLGFQSEVSEVIYLLAAPVLLKTLPAFF